MHLAFSSSSVMVIFVIASCSNLFMVLLEKFFVEFFFVPVGVDNSGWQWFVFFGDNSL